MDTPQLTERDKKSLLMYGMFLGTLAVIYGGYMIHKTRFDNRQQKFMQEMSDRNWQAYQEEQLRRKIDGP